MSRLNDLKELLLSKIKKRDYQTFRLVGKLYHLEDIESIINDENENYTEHEKKLIDENISSILIRYDEDYCNESWREQVKHAIGVELDTIKLGRK